MNIVHSQGLGGGTTSQAYQYMFTNSPDGFMQRIRFNAVPQTWSEWEYAARGGQRNTHTRTLGASGTMFRFSGSVDRDAVAWYATHPERPAGALNTRSVGTLAPNQRGIFDMIGNVAELLWDRFAARPICCAINPTGPDSGNRLTMDSGATFRSSTMISMNVSARLGGGMPHGRADFAGLRIAMSAR